MRRKWLVPLVCLGLLAIGVACSDEPAAPEGPYQLTFQGDATFQGAHGTQEMYVAVIRAADGEIVARASGEVSATTDPAFSFTFTGLLERDEEYQIHYWIDSNFGGGVEGACDVPATDHQWSVDVPAATDNVILTETHQPAAVMSVCASFSASLTFSGDATFQGAHGGQMISIGLVRSSDGLVIDRQFGTVLGTADPSFSFTFTGLLVIDEPYEVHYWIDSNFDSGTPGVCDLPAKDHQWNIDLGFVDGDVDHTEVHSPATITDVCATFP